MFHNTLLSDSMEEDSFKWRAKNRISAIEKIFSIAKGDMGKVTLAARCALQAYRETGCTEVIYIALTILAKLKIHDRELVGSIMDVLFSIKGNFLCLFSHTVFKDDGSAYGLLDDEESSEYFLTVVGDRCYEVGNDIIRFIDVPVGGLTLAAISAYMGSTSAVHLFLRHGADPQKILRVIKFPPLPGRMAIARLVARSTPYPGKELRSLLDLPNPPTLKHLCKFVIRYRLMLNNFLPIGIGSLPLFRQLQRYIDLLED
ncbi:uncharacterized protein LOC106665801 [Cimex lectularius]|uniref:SOCS box domain-containing protein n=1 Tax=Cimex lectularius TaxID=79782 RepID=A0A8I6RMN8_CIMLE|nr:uncharacterized protein LOC106665801 [Cimex lectularius]